MWLDSQTIYIGDKPSYKQVDEQLIFNQILFNVVL